MGIPFYPDYSIDSHGVVYGPSGRRLSVSKEGKVKLYKDGKRRAEEKIARYKEVAEEKIARAWRTVAAKEKERRYAIRRLSLARRINAHLLAMIRRDQPEADLSGLQIEE